MPAAYLCSQPQLVCWGARVVGGLQCGKAALPQPPHWHLLSKSLARGLSVNTGHVWALDTCNPMSIVQSHALNMLAETHLCKPIEPM